MARLFFTSVLLFFMVSFPAKAQIEDVKPFSEAISADELRHHVEILASDSLEGRKTGNMGQKEAAGYIASFFSKNEFGVFYPNNSSGYFQQFGINRRDYGYRQIIVLKNDKKDIYSWSHMLLAGNDSSYRQRSLPYYAGYLSPSSQNNIPANQATVIFQASNLDNAVQVIEEIRRNNDTRTFLINFPDNARYFKKLNKEYYGIHKDFFQEKELNKGGGLEKLTKEYCENSEIETILFNYTMEHPDVRVYIIDNKLFGRITMQKATRMAKLSKADRDIQLTLDSLEVYARHNDTLKSLSTENVLGYIKGSKYPDQFVVVIAHYDHIGIQLDGDVYNGANDNASGVATLMEVAKSFSEATKTGLLPEYSVLFIAATGEEIGLFGSKYFLTRPDLKPKNIVAAINMDMLGRSDKKHESKGCYVYAVAHKKFKRRNMKNTIRIAESEVRGVDVDFTPGILLRYAAYETSDQHFFIKNDIPSLSFSTGMYEDLHTINDTPDKINYNNMENIARLVFLTTWQLAHKSKL